MNRLSDIYYTTESYLFPMVEEEICEITGKMEVISKVFKNVRKFLLRSVKWGVFGGYSVSSHAQPTIFSSSTILFQPNFAGLLKLPLKITS